MYHTNLKNGYGYEFALPGRWQQDFVPHFGPFAGAVLDAADGSQSCLVEGDVGAGKSHLVQDVQTEVLSRGLASFTLHAEISGGSRKGADHARELLDGFTEEYGSGGVIVVDNADYYGYSGSKGGRRYAVALAHAAVAEHLSELIDDTGAPMVIGTAHNDEWRAGHWMYGTRRPEDEVTPAAEALLESFGSRMYLSGELDPGTAEGFLIKRWGESMATVASAAVKELEEAGKLVHRCLKQLDPSRFLALGMEAELARIEDRSAQLARVGIGSQVAQVPIATP